jgi:hypothetical protein
MKIIYDVLEELLYFANEEFEVTYKYADENKNVLVYPFISKENASQVFLVLELKDENLKDVVDGTLVKEVAIQFRKKKYHRAEMDRNTTLLIMSEYRNDGEISKGEKVKIEDDPYYFKKYVFSYNEIGRKNAEMWIEKDGIENKLVERIQNYITDTKNFGRYKANNQNDPIYAYFIELITKIPSFPMKKVEAIGLKTIEQYLDEEIDILMNSKKPVEINKQVIEKFMHVNLDELNVENICNEWNRLLDE